MRTNRSTRYFAAFALAVSVTVAGCSRPAPNDAVRITGEKTDAVPPTAPTTTTSTTVAPSTTSYYGPGGPGATGN